jgi:hypothetical protein
LAIPPPPIFKEKLYEFSTKELQLLLLFVVRWQNFAKKKKKKKRSAMLNYTLPYIATISFLNAKRLVLKP